MFGVFGVFRVFRVFRAYGSECFGCSVWGSRGWLWGLFLGLAGQKRPEM